MSTPSRVLLDRVKFASLVALRFRERLTSVAGLLRLGGIPSCCRLPCLDFIEQAGTCVERLCGATTSMTGRLTWYWRRNENARGRPDVLMR